MAAICTFSEQLLAALNYRYNNNGEYEDSSRDASRKWLEQIAATGVLLHYQSLLSPSVVREILKNGFHSSTVNAGSLGLFKVT